MANFLKPVMRRVKVRISHFGESHVSVAKPERWMMGFGMVCLIWLLAGCGALRWHDNSGSERHIELNREPHQYDPSKAAESLQDGEVVTLTNQLGRFYQQWEGTPYAYGGESLDGIDCSALAQHAARSVLGVDLPRTTAQQLAKGFRVEPSQATTGDLVFFRTGDSIGHVGMLLGSHKFMHSSKSSGVTVSRLDDDYWRSRVIQYRRILHPNSPQ